MVAIVRRGGTHAPPPALQPESPTSAAKNDQGPREVPPAPPPDPAKSIEPTPGQGQGEHRLADERPSEVGSPTVPVVTKRPAGKKRPRSSPSQGDRPATLPSETPNHVKLIP